MNVESAKLLIDEYPLQVLPTLAELIGLNEAIILQQVHFWVSIARRKKESAKYREGFWWTYGTYEEWRENDFRWWSIPTIKRTFLSLEKAALLISRQFDAEDWDQKKWYRVNYAELDALLHGINLIPSGGSDLTPPSDQIDPILTKETETPSETLSETIPPDGGSPLPPESVTPEEETPPVEDEMFSTLLENGRPVRNAGALTALQAFETRMSAGAAGPDLALWPEDVRPLVQDFIQVFNLPTVPQTKEKRGDWIASLRAFAREVAPHPPRAIMEAVHTLAKQEHWLAQIGRPGALDKSIIRGIKLYLENHAQPTPGTLTPSQQKLSVQLEALLAHKQQQEAANGQPH